MKLRIGMLSVSMAAVAVAGLSGCGAGYERFAQGTERSYSVSYDADARSGALSVTFRPAGSPGPGAPNPVQGMDDETIARLAQVVWEAARRNAAKEPPVIVPGKSVVAVEGERP